MPLAPSMLSAVPNFLQQPALAGSQAMPQAGPAGIPAPPTAGMLPGFGGGAPMMPSPPPGAVPGSVGAMGSQPGAGGGQPGMDMMGPPDLVDKLVRTMMGMPNIDAPFGVAFMAGIGAKELLEKMGKFASKPHRSNAQLAQQGYDTGNVGQTGMPSPQEMGRNLQPPMPMPPGGPAGRLA